MKRPNQRVIAAGSKRRTKKPHPPSDANNLFLSYVLLVALPFCVAIFAIYITAGIQQKIQVSESNIVSSPAMPLPNAGINPGFETALNSGGEWSTNAISSQP